MSLPSSLSRGVCVFCASSDRVADIYKNLAQDLGALAASERWHVVYGGAKGGLMGLVADSAMAGGAQVTGVMPDVLAGQERAHQRLTKLYTTKDMHERQKMMMDLSQGFVVLPGGVGTLTEFFEVLTWKQIGLHTKPIAIINHGGYWDSLLEMLENAEENGFLHHSAKTLFTVFMNINDLKGFFNFK